MGKSFKYFIDRHDAITTKSLKDALDGARSLSENKNRNVTVSSDCGVIGYVEPPYMTKDGVAMPSKFRKF